MSEEQKPCKFKLLLGLIIVSLLMSIASLTMSILSYTGTAGGEHKVVISKKYDRGRSLAKAKDTNKPMLVFFYTDWCGFCQKFAPTFDKITKDSRIKKDFAVAFVNCEKPENSKIVSEYKITGFPTVYVVDDNGEKTQLDNKKFFDDNAKEEVIKEAIKILNK